MEKAPADPQQASKVDRAKIFTSRAPYHTQSFDDLHNIDNHFGVDIQDIGN